MCNSFLPKMYGRCNAYADSNPVFSSFKKNNFATTHSRRFFTALMLMFLFINIKGWGQTSVTYSTAGTYTWLCPPGVTSITVECWGAGGGGGGVYGNSGLTKYGGGGAGGGYVRFENYSVTPGTTYSLRVGTGGAAGGVTSGSDASNAGGAGTSSFFVNSSTINAAGGAGGTGKASSSNNFFGLGASASSNTCTGCVANNTGGNGGNATSTASGAGGEGAATTTNGTNATGGSAGTGTDGGDGAAGKTSSANGDPGTAPGGGGSGGWTNNTTNRNGGTGGDGQVKISINTPLCVPLFEQNFTNTTIANYIQATSPSHGQFNEVTSTGTAPTINSGQLRFNRSSGNHVFTRTTDLNPTPTSLIYQFSLTVSGNSSAQNAGALIRVGDSYTASTSDATDANTHSQIGISWTSTAGQFSIRNIGASTNSSNFSGQQTITWVINNSGGQLSYRAPDGTIETINNDTWDLWISTTKAFDNIGATTATKNLTDLKFFFGLGTAIIDIDNILIAPIPNAPTSSAATSITSSGFTANWNSVSCASGYRLDVSTASDFSSFVSGYENLDVGNVTSYALTGLNASTQYYYRVRSYNAYTVGTFTSGNSSTQTLTTDASSVTVTLGSNAPAAANVCSGTNKLPLQSFTIVSSNGAGNLTNVGFTTTGTYVQADISKYQLWFSSSNDISGATQLGTDLSSSGGAGARTFSAFSSPTLTNGITYYFWITADVSSSVSAQRTIAVNGIATSDLTSGSNKAGSTTSAGGTQTLFAAFTAGSIATTGQSICTGTTPSAIGNSVLSSGGDGTITYQWQSSTAADFSANLTTISSNTSGYTFSSGLSATTYYRRQAKDGTCNTGWTNSTGSWLVAVNQIPATSPAASHTNTGQTTTNVRFTWTTPADADGVNVYDATSNTLLQSGNTSGQYDYTTTANTQVGIKLKSYKGLTSCENASFGTAAFAYSSQNAPTGITFSGVGLYNITATASGSFANLTSGSSGLYISNTTASTNSGWYTNAATGWANTSLDCGTSYSFTIKARNGDGDETATVGPTAQSTTVCPPVQYRSIANGNWTTASVWERSIDAGTTWIAAVASPTSSDGTITIRDTDTITISTNLSIDETTINAGGRINYTGGTLTINNGIGTDLIINGTFSRTSSNPIINTGQLNVESGGVYISNFAGATIPTATWNANATLQIDASIADDEFTESFGHVTINGTSSFSMLNLSSASSITINGNLTFNSSGTVVISKRTNATTCNIGGDLILSGAGILYGNEQNLNNAVGALTLNITGNYVQSNGTFIGNDYNSNFTMNITGNLSLSAGNFTISDYDNNGLSRTYVLNLTGNYDQTGGTFNMGKESTSGSITTTFNVDGNFSHTGGTLTDGTVNSAKIVIKGTASTSFATIGQSGTLEFVINKTGAAPNNIISVSANTTISTNTTLTLTLGVFSLGSNNFTFNNYASLSVSSPGPGTTKMFAPEGTGELRFPVFAVNVARDFPVGDVTGTVQYSPITVTVTSGTISSAFIGVSLADAKHPDNYSPTDFTTRYWNVKQTGITNCVATISGTFTSSTADINGTLGNIKSSQLNGTFNSITNNWITFGSGLTTNLISCTGATLTAGTTSVFTGVSYAGPVVSISGTTPVCQNSSVTLTANVTGVGPFTYSWSGGLGSGSTATPSTASAGTTSYTVTVTDNLGLSTTSSAYNLTVNAPPTVANAGEDQTGVATCGLTQVTLAGNASTSGSGLWTVVTGTGGSFGDAASPVSTFSGTAGSSYTLRWTISNNPCAASTDDMVVTFNRVTTSNAGSTINQCSNGSFTMAANAPTFGTGSWSLVSGTANITDPSLRTTTVTGVPLESSATLRWTITNTPCTSSSDVVIWNRSVTWAGTTSSNWHTGSNWSCGSIPTSTSDVVIPQGTPNAPVISANAAAKNITINSGATLSMSATTAFTLDLPVNTTFTNNGSFIAGLGTVAFAGAATINGSATTTLNNINLNGVTTLTTAPVINGIATLNSGASVSASAPVYGNVSTLRYSNGSAYTTGLEWNQSAGTIGSTAGYPNNVTVQNNTSLQLNSLSSFGTAGNLTINSGASLSASGQTNPLRVGANLDITGTLTLSDQSGNDLYVAGNFTRTGTFTHNNKAVYFNGSGNSVITATGGQNFNKLYLTKSAKSNTLTLSDSLSISEEIKITTGTLNLSNKNITLLSNVNKTASFGQMGVSSVAGINYSGTGRFIVERFINTGTGTGEHGKSWQLLAVPTSGQTIKEAWQEGATSMSSNPKSGYGTILTSNLSNATSVGFDVFTRPGPSIKTWDAASQNWVGPSSTNVSIADSRGYIVFVRGDRSITSATAAANNTILRTKGTLYTPENAPPLISMTNEGFHSVGNPYASTIDFDVITKSNNVSNNFIVFDPTLRGSYGVGGYQTITAVTGYLASPGNFRTTSTYYNTTSSYNTLQSGQAFFVTAISPNASLSFKESDKVNGSRLVFRPIGNAGQISMLSSNLLAVNSDASLDLADGNRVVFDDQYSDAFDRFDAVKLLNGGENFGLFCQNKVLAVEARSGIKSEDTLFYNMSGLRPMQYQLMFIPQNLHNEDIQAELVDRFLNSRTAVSLIDTSYITIDITDNPLSNAPDRFMLVFNSATAGPVPVTFTSITANRNREGKIDVNWKTENEVNIKHYELERSSNGRAFDKINTKAAAANNGSNASYSHLDETPLQGANFYRVKAIGENGQVQYSAIVKVAGIDATPAIAVYPNPVKDGRVNVSFTNKPAGNYNVQMINSIGQVVYSSRWNVPSGNNIRTIELSSRFKPWTKAGIYQLRIVSEEGESEVINVQIIQ